MPSALSKTGWNTITTANARFSRPEQWIRYDLTRSSQCDIAIENLRLPNQRHQNGCGSAFLQPLPHTKLAAYGCFGLDGAVPGSSYKDKH
jgi:hypothetical protein